MHLIHTNSISGPVHVQLPNLRHGRDIFQGHRGSDRDRVALCELDTAKRVECVVLTPIVIALAS